VSRVPRPKRRPARLCRLPVNTAPLLPQVGSFSDSPLSWIRVQRVLAYPRSEQLLAWYRKERCFKQTMLFCTMEKFQYVDVVVAYLNALSYGDTNSLNEMLCTALTEPLRNAPCWVILFVLTLSVFIDPQ